MVMHRWFRNILDGCHISLFPCGMRWLRGAGRWIVEKDIVACVALCDILTCFITCRKSFCVAGAILLRRFQTTSCIFRGRRSTLLCPSCFCVAGAALQRNRIVRAARKPPASALLFCISKTNLDKCHENLTNAHQLLALGVNPDGFVMWFQAFCHFAC